MDILELLTTGRAHVAAAGGALLLVNGHLAAPLAVVGDCATATEREDLAEWLAAMVAAGRGAITTPAPCGCVAAVSPVRPRHEDSPAHAPG